MQNKNLRATTLIAVLSAVSIVLILLDFPLLPSSPHLKMDFSTLPAIAAAGLINPLAGVLVLLIKVLIELILKGAGSTMGFGNIIDFLTGCSMLLPIIFIWRIDQNRETRRPFILVLTAVSGVVGILIVGLISNYFIAPPYFQYVVGVTLSPEAVWAQVATATIFNLIKGTIIAILSIPLLELVSKRFKGLFQR